jgi:hypothetical protein
VPTRPEPEQPGRLVLNAAHVGGSALAAVTAAVAASSFGVAGTLLGAAFGAAVTAVGGALYQHSLEQARYKVLALRANGYSVTRPAANGTAASEPGEPAGRRRLPWWPLVALSGIGFVVAMIAITASETAIGHPVSGSRSGSGTTIGRVINDRSSGTPSTPTPSTSVTATTVPTPSDTGTPAPFPTDPVPSQTPPPTGTGVPTGPTGGATPPADGGTQPPAVPSSR